MGFAYTLAVLLIAATINSFGNGVLRPVLTSRITQLVGRHEQGIALGISGSLSSLAMTIAPITGGFWLDSNNTLGWSMVAAAAALARPDRRDPVRGSQSAAGVEARPRNCDGRTRRSRTQRLIRSGPALSSGP